MTDHLDGTNHHWEFVMFVNQMYSMTAVASADVLVICHKCGAWKIVAQEYYTPTGGLTEADHDRHT